MPLSASVADRLATRLRSAGCVFAEAEAALLLGDGHHGEELERMVTARCNGTPLEHVLGWAEFAGARIVTEPGVFVPRSRSELLIEVAVPLVLPGDVVVDMCCGTGAVGAVIADHVPALDLYACDVDPAAVACARRNLARRGGHVHLGDLDAPLPRTLLGRVQLIVANAPYVPTAEIELLPHEAKDHEPRHALDGGDDGLTLHRRLAALAPRWLVAGGHLLIETSEGLAPSTAALMAAADLAVTIVRSEEDDATVAVGRANRV